MNRRQFLQVFAALSASVCNLSLKNIGSNGFAFGDDDLFTLGILRYNSPNWNSRPSALRRLSMEAEMTTSVLIAEDSIEINPTMEEIFLTPMLVMGGDRDFDPWSSEVRDTIRSFLNAGGTLLIDSSEGRIGAFYSAVLREFAEIFPGNPLAPISNEHVIFKSFYLVNGSVGRTVIQEHMEGIEHDGRMSVIFTHNDLMGAWERDNFGNNTYECFPGGERQRTLAHRLGVNLIMYSLCLDYKEDQVHIPFILNRRRWRVE